MSVKVGVVGGSGYTGGELLRILAVHPNVEVTYVTSREYAGKPFTAIHPHLRGFYKGLKFSEVSVQLMAEKCDTVFVNTPHGVSSSLTPQLLEIGLKVVDLSADFRLKNHEDYRIWYEAVHPRPDLLEKAVYGLPELYREKIRSATLVACPGCNSTAALLSLIPAFEQKLVDVERIAVDLKVGSSEAGIKPSLGTHHPERANVMRPYEAEGHRHVAEVEQELSKIAGKPVKVALVPHAVGAVRGALASSHVWLQDPNIDETDIWKAYAARYGKEPFVRIVHGTPFRYPDPKYVIGSNFVDVGFAVEKRIGRAVFFAAIDNLMKGAAGQAVQCFNILHGFDERAGLNSPPLRPA
ncbi:MAG: N-acetyl-gamma-glutamyl-phosphate reductase [Candidatus Caldarchaeum sp.]|nr:N-acetyl-gamma-glutamyl-phosphate reductase [Candidatus Caldarchaeum sp.]MCS7134231.1 N-acetyl-gamma-glutamyl-phosphate reductase [Candidatus Caldarchaeum sp.]MCX8201419.1 N-acetyl-gamma-glutamyl-phosphate reductase [Candidatus Caldarchaeum sp.]MDW8435097.1 N-acetyl-gamma-glutamyl-phosphate reductase [Candidatus Caldarchaeum sp.]